MYTTQIDSDGIRVSTVTLIILGAWFLVYEYVSYDKRRRQLPPGPRGLPIIGSMLKLRDPDKIAEFAQELQRDYGEIAHTKIGATDYIWLSSPTVVKELMDKRGSIYSDRPRMPMAFEAVSNQRRQFFMPYGDRWRSVRRVSHAALNLKSSNTYTPVQDFESKQLMWELLHAKNDWSFYDFNRRYSSSVIMQVTYGHRIPNWDDPLYKKIFTVLDHFNAMAEPGKWLVDLFPSLASLPSWMVQNWWTKGREWHKFDSEVYLDLYRNLISEVKAGNAADCFVKDFYLGNPEKNGIDEETAAYTCGSLVEAGSESTSTVINNWLLACLLFPNVVKQAQEELDRVVGKDRLPSFEDEPNLPYIRAMVKESLRWRPITKIGAPHSTSEDDWYNGFFIPKGSTVILSWWAIHFDPSKWTDAQSFDPMRYYKDSLSTAEALNAADPNNRDHYTYGAGRRVCSGIHVAQNSLFIIMARLMWAFNVKKSRNGSGEVIEPTTETESGFLAIPHRFPCHMEPRSKEHGRVVEEAWSDAQKVGLEWSRKSSTL